MADRMIKIGVFYDAQFFFKVSTHYAYFHPRRSRISLSGLHDLIEWKVSKEDGLPRRDCKVIDAHYFKGRIPTSDITGEQAMKERKFEETLMYTGITTHYLPLVISQNNDFQYKEKGIDVWLALEALDQALIKGYDVLALVAGDGDYLPLIRKLNAHGVKVMVVGWNLFHRNRKGRTTETRTAPAIIREADYPVIMNDLIQNPSPEERQIVDSLFL